MKFSQIFLIVIFGTFCFVGGFFVWGKYSFTFDGSVKIEHPVNTSDNNTEAQNISQTSKNDLKIYELIKQIHIFFDIEEYQENTDTLKQIQILVNEQIQLTPQNIQYPTWKDLSTSMEKFIKNQWKKGREDLYKKTIITLVWYSDIVKIIDHFEESIGKIITPRDGRMLYVIRTVRMYIDMYELPYKKWFNREVFWEIVDQLQYITRFEATVSSENLFMSMREKIHNTDVSLCDIQTKINAHIFEIIEEIPQIQELLEFEMQQIKKEYSVSEVCSSL